MKTRIEYLAEITALARKVVQYPAGSPQFDPFDHIKLRKAIHAYDEADQRGQFQNEKEISTHC